MDRGRIVDPRGLVITTPADTTNLVSSEHCTRHKSLLSDIPINNNALVIFSTLTNNAWPGTVWALSLSAVKRDPPLMIRWDYPPRLGLICQSVLA